MQCATLHLTFGASGSASGRRSGKSCSSHSGRPFSSTPFSACSTPPWYTSITVCRTRYQPNRPHERRRFHDQCKSPINPYMHQGSRLTAKRRCANIPPSKSARRRRYQSYKVTRQTIARTAFSAANWALTRGNKALMSHLPNVRQAEEAYAAKVLEEGLELHFCQKISAWRPRRCPCPAATTSLPAPLPHRPGRPHRHL